MLKKEDKMGDLQDLLDSDDELPTTYNEVPETPAYLNDSRFDTIQFSWLNTGHAKKCPKKKEAVLAPVKASFQYYAQSTESPPEVYQGATLSMEKAPFTYHEENTIQYLRKAQDDENINRCGTYQQSSDSRTLMIKGILNEQDILCMKTFAALTTDDEALLWFIDFLIYKDLQSDYKFLTSCLVGHQLDQEGQSRLDLDLPNFSNKYFNLVVI